MTVDGTLLEIVPSGAADRTGEATCGATRGEPRRLDSVFPAEAARVVAGAVEMSLASRVSRSVSFFVDDGAKHFEARVTPWSDRAALVIARDTTEIDSLRVKAALANRMLALGTLAAAVAHEINNPLTYVMMNLETLRDRLAPRAGSDPASWEEKTILEEIRSGVERVRGAVDDLRRVARPEEKPGGDVDVRRVLELSIKLADHEIKHRARLVRDFGEIPSVTATEAALGQVFLDILINAAHAIADGAAAENEIRVVTRTDVAGRAVVEIRDTGAGMAQGIRARIFEPFFTTKAQGIGTGLGLSISYATVTSLGGFIEVESAEGRGSTFRVVLPPADASPVAAPDPPAPKVGAPSGKVLIVDDEPAIGRALARVIGRDRTVVVTSGREALALILEGKGFDAVLCDLMMPEMSGVDLYEELMRVAPEQAKKIVFMSGGAFTERARSFLARVGNAFLQKPIDTAKLLALVQQVMSG